MFCTYVGFDGTRYTGCDMDGAGSVTSPSSRASKCPRTADASPVFSAAWELCSCGPWSSGNTVKNLQNSAQADTVHILHHLSTTTVTYLQIGSQKVLTLVS